MGGIIRLGVGVVGGPVESEGVVGEDVDGGDSECGLHLSEVEGCVSARVPVAS